MKTPLMCAIAGVKGVFVNCSLIVRALFYLLQLSEAEVVILFAVALNDPQAGVWAFLVTCAGQDRRRVRSAQCPGTIVCGPVLTSFGQSFHGEKHHHLRPKRRPHKMYFSSMISNKYIDVLVTRATSSWQLPNPQLRANEGVISL